MKTKRQFAFGIALALGLTIYGATTLSAPRAPRIETGPDAEASFDGLHRVQRSVMAFSGRDQSNAVLSRQGLLLQLGQPRSALPHQRNRLTSYYPRNYINFNG